MNTVLQDIWHWLEHNNHPLTDLRVIIWFIFFALIAAAWLAAHIRSRKRTEEDEKNMIAEHFPKDEDGLYPWEKESEDDLHPHNVKKGTKPYKLDNLPQRGRWRV